MFETAHVSVHHTIFIIFIHQITSEVWQQILNTNFALRVHIINITMTNLVALNMTQVNLTLVSAKYQSQALLERVFAIFVSFLYWIQDAFGLMSVIIFLFIFQSYAQTRMCLFNILLRLIIINISELTCLFLEFLEVYVYCLFTLSIELRHFFFACIFSGRWLLTWAKTIN